MEEAPENSKESSHFAHANGINEAVVTQWLNRLPPNLVSELITKMYFSNSVLDNMRTICTTNFYIPIKRQSGQTVICLANV